MTENKIEENVVYTIAREQLTKKDYDEILPVLEEAIRKFGKIRWYFEMQNFKGWTPEAAWEDINFDFSNKEHLKKVAMVGDKEWEKGITKIMKPFTDADIKFFQLEEKSEANVWIKS